MKTTIPTILGLLLAVSSLVCAVEPAPPIEQVQTTQADAAPAPDPAVIAKVTAKALAGDWKQVLELTEGVDLAHPSPVLKLVRGHACLALNYNNEATVLLFGTRDPQQLQAYQAWAGEHLAKNPDQPYARFFAGDAAARLGQWDEALREFDAAIRFKQDFALAYNARGAANALRKDIGAANNDFSRASELDSRLADAYNSAGYLWVQRKEGGAKGATSAFSKAIENAPDFSLALHGRGCVQLASGHVKVAYDDLRRADTQDPALLPLLLENEIRYVVATTGVSNSDLLTALSGPGSPFQASTRERVIGDLDRAIAIRASLKGMPGGELAAAWIAGNHAVKEIADYNARTGAKMDLGTPERQQAAVDFASNGRKWNDYGGGARHVITDIDIVGHATAAAGGVHVGITTGPWAGFRVQQVGVAITKGVVSWLNQGTSQNLRRSDSVVATYRDRNTNPAVGAPSGETPSPKTQPGGALADPPVLNGKWPFVAIYGLGYGIVE